jgi:hypothetical protein
MLHILILAMALPVTMPDSPDRQVRSPEPRILALIDEGLSRSITFRRLVDTLNESDVIVYVVFKNIRTGGAHESLGGYLDHQVVSAGDFRYVRLFVDKRGGAARLIGVIAHELQHAIEVAHSPAVRDSRTLQRVFDCVDACETQEALDVQRMVTDELSRPQSLSVPPTAATASEAAIPGRVRDNGDSTIADLIRDGRAHSDTFRRLLATIDASDGLVYVDRRKCRPGVRTCLQMTVVVAGPNRILTVHLGVARDGPDVIALLGHELQHAIEVLREPGIRSAALMYMFYDRLNGSPSAHLGQREFETEAALQTGTRVRAEYIASMREHR